MREIKELCLFSGYGGSVFALSLAGIPHKCIGYSDIEDCANYIFALNHGEDIPQLGDITKINPDDLEDFDLLTGGFPCFLAGTLITTQRGQIPIQDVVVGDMVLTHMNRWRKVIDIMSYIRDHYYKVNIQGAGEIKATGNHNFYGRKMISVWNKSKRQSFRQWSDVEWIFVDEMQKDDFFAIGTWSDKYATNEKNLTNEECWLIGRYVADGYIQNGLRKGRKNSYEHKVIFCIGKKKKEEFLEKTKNIPHHIGVTEDRTAYKYRIMNEEFMNLCLECGKGAINKKIPFWIMNLPKKKLQYFLDGYMSGDGYFNEKNNYRQATSINKILIYQLGQVVNRLYKTPYNINYCKRPKTTIIEGRMVNQKDTWAIKYQKNTNKQDNAKWIGNNLWVRFNSKEKIIGKVKTYNITVEEDHSYVANNIIVKNCQSFSIAGKREGFENETKGQLFFEIIRIAKVKKPRYMLLENVQGIISHDNNNTMRVILDELQLAGYYVRWKLLYSKEHGTPQNRPRVWFACFREKEDAEKFLFPEKEELKITVKDLLEDVVDEKYYLSKTQLQRLMTPRFNSEFKNPIKQNLNEPFRTLTSHMSRDVCDVPFFEVADFRYDEGIRPRKDGVAPILASSQKGGQGLSGCPIIMDNKTKNSNESGVSGTVRAGGGSGNNILTNYKNRWRRLTPRECFRLQGFFKDQIKFGNLSDSKLYFLAGNGWDVQVALKIFSQMFKGNQNQQKGLEDF